MYIYMCAYIYIHMYNIYMNLIYIYIHMFVLGTGSPMPSAQALPPLLPAGCRSVFPVPDPWAEG